MDFGYIFKALTLQIKKRTADSQIDVLNFYRYSHKRIILLKFKLNNCDTINVSLQFKVIFFFFSAIYFRCRLRIFAILTGKKFIFPNHTMWPKSLNFIKNTSHICILTKVFYNHIFLTHRSELCKVRLFLVFFIMKEVFCVQSRR